MSWRVSIRGRGREEKAGNDMEESSEDEAVYVDTTKTTSESVAVVVWREGQFRSAGQSLCLRDR
jgi:hypothetical protein